MLYIFHVDTGRMLTFEMNLALGSVNDLKDEILRVHHISPDKQVLLVSGGVSLDPNARVCSYTAGTDTNPIYLFSKSILESQTPPSPSTDYGPDLDFRAEVEATMGMPNVYNAVVVRAQLAHKLYESSRDQTHICERLVHDQHLQQQGWAAVVANLEDITSDFDERCKLFRQNFNQYLQSRLEFLELLKTFKEDLALLSKIPVIPVLLEGYSDIMKRSDDVSQSEKSDEVDSSLGAEKGNSTELNKHITLLEWISKTEPQNKLDQVAELCSRGLEQFVDKTFDVLSAEVDSALEAANKLDMKEIKGLEERLFGLEQLMFETKKIVQEQSDLAQGVRQNQNRASNLGDQTVLPDLCTSHRKQLTIMLQNYQQLRDIRRRCTKAKEELSTNLYHRLRWVMYVENKMCEMDNKLVIYHESLRRLKLHLGVLQQIHLAPQKYIDAVMEVVRRRTFSQSFLQWANDLSHQLAIIYNEEVEKRREFQSHFDGHFLTSLFPGMEDVPPPFATEAPTEFDEKLPKISLDDAGRLCDNLPELDISISLPDLTGIMQYFSIKSVSGTLKTEDVGKDEVSAGKNFTSRLEPSLLQPAEEDIPVQGYSPSPVSLHEMAPIKEQDRGFESETDTEEFEKVGQSPIELGFDPKQAEIVTGSSAQSGEGAAAAVVGLLEVGVSCDSAWKVSPTSPKPNLSHLLQQQQDFTTTDFYIDESMPSSYTESNSIKSGPEVLRQLEDMHLLIALLQENLGNTREEVEVFRERMKSLSHLVTSSTTLLRTELSDLKKLMFSESEVFSTFYHELTVILPRKFEALQNAQEFKQLMEKEAQELHKRELVQRLTVDHELEMDAFKKELKALEDTKDEQLRDLSKQLSEKDNELLQLHTDMENRLLAEKHNLQETSTVLSNQISSLQQRCEELQQLLATCDSEKEKAVQEVSERLRQDFKIEVEGLRSRFKLMTTASMERSPSDSSLEKIEKPEVSEILNQEAAFTQLRETLMAEKEAAVKQAVEESNKQWEIKFTQEIRSLRARLEAEKQIWFNEAMRRIVHEKEKLSSKASSLENENLKLQSAIRHVKDDKNLSSSDLVENQSLLSRLKLLENEKQQLESELAKERSRKRRSLSETAMEEPKCLPASSMSTSVAVVEGAHSQDVGTSPEPVPKPSYSDKLKGKLTKSTSSLVQEGKLSLHTCNTGDAVVIVWDSQHRCYAVAQESGTLYFVHPDCLGSLSLSLPMTGTSPHCTYRLGEVVDKEYCQAKKADNRYQVPIGTKFYRVKVRPLVKDNLPRSRHQQQDNSGSRSSSTSSGAASKDATKM